MGGSPIADRRVARPPRRSVQRRQRRRGPPLPRCRTRRAGSRRRLDGARRDRGGADREIRPWGPFRPFDPALPRFERPAAQADRPRSNGCDRGLRTACRRWRAHRLRSVKGRWLTEPLAPRSPISTVKRACAPLNLSIPVSPAARRRPSAHRNEHAQGLGQRRVEPLLDSIRGRGRRRGSREAEGRATPRKPLRHLERLSPGTSRATGPGLRRGADG